MAEMGVLDSLSQAATTVAQSLVQAGGLKAATGFLADILSLFAARVASSLPQSKVIPLLPFALSIVLAVMSVVLAVLGTSAIAIFFLRRTPTPSLPSTPTQPAPTAAPPP